MQWKWIPLALLLLAVVAAREYGLTFTARAARGPERGVLFIAVPKAKNAMEMDSSCTTFARGGRSP